MEQKEKTQIVKVDPKEFGLEEKQANEITKGLQTIRAEREILKEQYNQCILLEITPNNIEQFRKLRLLIRDNRTKGTDVWHKVNKEYFLRGGQFCDALRNKDNSENEYMEGQLLNGEKFYENQEKERVQKLITERTEILKDFVENAIDYPVGQMTEEAFSNLIEGQKLIKIQKEAAEKKAEDERIEKEKAEIAERERIIEENKQLLIQAEAMEKAAEIERKKAAKILADQQAKAKEEKRVADAKIEKEIAYQKQIVKDAEFKAVKVKEETDRLAKIESDKQAKILAESQAKAKQEAEAREKAEKELKAKQLADAKIQFEKEQKEKEEKAAKKAAEKAPDKEKLLSLIKQLCINVPELKSNESKEVAKEILQKFNGFKTWAETLINNL